MNEDSMLARLAKGAMLLSVEGYTSVSAINDIIYAGNDKVDETVADSLEKLGWRFDYETYGAWYLDVRGVDE